MVGITQCEVIEHQILIYAFLKHGSWGFLNFWLVQQLYLILLLRGWNKFLFVKFWRPCPCESFHILSFDTSILKLDITSCVFLEMCFLNVLYVFFFMKQHILVTFWLSYLRESPLSGSSHLKRREVGVGDSYLISIVALSQYLWVLAIGVFIFVATCTLSVT